MALKVGGSNGQPKPFYVNECKVASVSVVYNEPSPFNSDIVNDVALEIKYISGNNSEPFTLNIRGSFKRDPLASNAVSDWGSAFKVRRFFEALGITGDLEDDNTIPADWFQEAVGKTFFKLDYVIAQDEETGKYKYRSWDIVGKTAEKITSEFLKENDRGYPTAYTPSLLYSANQQPNPFPFGANAVSNNPIF